MVSIVDGSKATTPRSRRTAGLSHVMISVVSTEGPLDFARGKLRPERRDLLSTKCGLLWREGLSARPFGPWSRRRESLHSSHAIALRRTGWRRAGASGMLAVPATRRCRRAKTGSENCGNAKCSGSARETKGLRSRLAMAKTGGTLAETAETLPDQGGRSGPKISMLGGRLDAAVQALMAECSAGTDWRSACGNCGNFPDCTAICAFTSVVHCTALIGVALAEIAEIRFAAHPCGERVRNRILTLRQMCPRHSRHSGAA